MYIMNATMFINEVLQRFCTAVAVSTRAVCMRLQEGANNVQYDESYLIYRIISVASTCNVS